MHIAPANNGDVDARRTLHASYARIKMYAHQAQCMNGRWVSGIGVKQCIAECARDTIAVWTAGGCCMRAMRT